MTPQDVSAGEPWLVELHGRRFMAIRDEPEWARPWQGLDIVTGDLERCYDQEVTLVSRLVPEVEA